MEPHEDPVCRICFQKVPVPSARQHDDTVAVQCSTCGNYEIRPDAYLALHEVYTEQKRYLLSGRARTAQSETGLIHRFDLEQIQAMKSGWLRDKTFDESSLTFIRWLAHQGAPGRLIEVQGERDYPTGYCRDGSQFAFLLEELRARGHIAPLGRVSFPHVMLTGDGWRWLEDQIKVGTGQQAFIAMSFSPAMAKAEAALRAGVLAAGYHPVLVKDRQFTDGIVDRVYTEIRRSHFVVADYTENNNGAYLEAGFGLGLGLRVIGTCEAGQLNPSSNNRVHFDVRGMNIIGWERNNLADLTERLKQRILALFPQGPVKPERQ